ncbi:MAG: glycosyltransferase [Clostridia bacterium]|nr:glycosyltransferase [Clostridia bacterium]
MKIAIICDVLGTANNGTSLAAFNLINSLKEKGHDVRVVCPDEDKRGQEGYYIVPKYNFGLFQRYMEKNGVSPAKADKTILESAISDADIIHVMVPFSLGKAAAAYANQHGIPLTAGFHCQAENITSHIFLKNSRIANKTTYRILNRRLFRYCDCIHYPTQFICDVFESVVGKTPHRIISNGVSDDFKPGINENTGRNGYTIVYSGRYSPEKSHGVLIDAVAKSHHKNEIRLVFAGTGPLRKKLEKRAGKKGINPPVMKFYGREELASLLKQADLYVHPAEIEIEAISCLEAIATGKVPVISDSPKSATKHFALTPQNLFRCGDSDDLAGKIDWWLDHPEERNDCAKRYIGFAEQFNFSRCMDEMEKMLIDTVEEKKHET